MKKHTKVYMDYFGYGIEDFIPSEMSGEKAVDIHHIENRKSGGSKDKDNIENLMALTRKEHEDYGDVPELVDKLKEIHLKFMDINGKH